MWAPVTSSRVRGGGRVRGCPGVPPLASPDEPPAPGGPGHCLHRPTRLRLPRKTRARCEGKGGRPPPQLEGQAFGVRPPLCSPSLGTRGSSRGGARPMRVEAPGAAAARRSPAEHVHSASRPQVPFSQPRWPVQVETLPGGPTPRPPSADPTLPAGHWLASAPTERRCWCKCKCKCKTGPCPRAGERTGPGPGPGQRLAPVSVLGPP